MKIIFNGDLATLHVGITDQAIARLSALFEPGNGRIPIFHLGTFIVELRTWKRDQEKEEYQGNLDDS